MTMKKLALLLLLLLTALPVQADPTWKKMRFEVVPGESAGPFQLGQPIPDEAYTLLGQPKKTGENQLTWGVVESFELVKGLAVFLEDGNVSKVMMTNVRAVTDRGAYLGMPSGAFKKLYPEGTATYSDFYDGDIFKIPGMTVILPANGKAYEMTVESDS